MFNEIWWFALMIVTLFGIVLAYRFFGRAGLYAWIAISTVVANIQVLKTIEIFGFVTAEGNIIYASIFLAMDILNENYGRKSARRGIMLGFFMLIAVTILMQMTLKFIPHESDTMGPALDSIFSFFPRIVFASLTAYLISQYINVTLFQLIKSWTKERFLWMRNIFSTVVAQLVDNIIFTYIAFVGLFGIFGWGRVFEWSIILQIFTVSIFMKYIVAVLDTPFLYYAKSIKKKVKDE